MIQTIKDQLQHKLFAIAARTDLSREEKTLHVIHLFSAGCAASAVQPLPRADYFVLTPLQAWMGERLSAIHGIPLSREGAGQLFKELSGVCGMGLMAQPLILGAYKGFLPFIAGVTTVPLVYGATYAIGRAMSAYQSA